MQLRTHQRGRSTVVTSDLVRRHESIQARLDQVVDSYRAGESRQELRAALALLLELMREHFSAMDDRISPFDHRSEYTVRRMGHQSLLRYIEHAVMRSEAWEATQLQACLRFLDHAITSQLHDELYHATQEARPIGQRQDDHPWLTESKTVAMPYSGEI